MSQYKTIAQFEIPYLQYLDAQGKAVSDLPSHAYDKELLHKLYEMMVLTRTFDQKAINLQRTGQLGTYPSSLWQEAIYVTMAASMKQDDLLCPYYRDYAAMFARGVRMEEILLYWGGDERGSNFSNNKKDLPICVPIASQTLHAVGAAFAFSYKKEEKVVVVSIGDGGTSRGDFYEAMNVAGAWNLPVIFVINNNQWAISVPRENQTKASTLAQKGIACGIPGVQVDGNDVLALKEVFDKAISNAREGKGPYIIEAMTYRMCDHTTADDASRYRKDEEVQSHMSEDPILRLKAYMQNEAKIGWSDAQEQACIQKATLSVDKAVENYLNTPVQPLGCILDYMYETLPRAYEAQYQELTSRQK